MESKGRGSIIANFLGRKSALRSLVGVLRDAEWLTVGRARAWCRVLAIVTLIVIIGWIVLARNGLDVTGKPLGTDFSSFWTASELALMGRPAAAYDPVQHGAVQQALFPAGQRSYYAFFYPPMFLLVCLPLALLPYLASLTTWLLAGSAALIGCLRRILPQRWAILPMLTSPAFVVNTGHGQNGFLSATCLGGALLLMERRPFLAGLCLGSLSFKPHLLLAAPVMLLAARRWMVIAGAAAATLGLAAASWLILGTGTWAGFLQASSMAKDTLENGLVEPWKMQSAFAAVRLLHGGKLFAYSVQLALASGILILLGRYAARRPGGAPEVALLAIGGLLCTPFVLDYDLTCLLVPVAWVMADAQRTGWQPWEKFVLLAAYVLPLVSRPLAEAGLPTATAVMGGMLLVVARRAAQVSA